MNKRKEWEKVTIDMEEFVIDSTYVLIKHIIGQREAREFLKLNRRKK